MRTIFLKFGGSLITDKDEPFTPRLDIIRSIGVQVKQIYDHETGIRLLVGHGSGSFGHAAAKATGFMESDITTFDHLGFQTVWAAAQKLNRIILDEFDQLGLPVIAFPPSASIRSSGKQIESWDMTPIRSALDFNLLPLVFGDTVFDSKLGGVIYSTEELFLHLAKELKPDLILLAGKEPGVWADFPEKNKIISELTEENFSSFRKSINASESVDVTGGMLKKVQVMFQIKKYLPNTKIHLFSGEEPGAIFNGLTGEPQGTAIK